MKKAKLKITLTNGAEFLVYEQNSKYYICENTQFKKTNPLIAKVEKIKVKAETKAETEEIEEEDVCR